jgi:ornithine cyclodeaminase/alanine dehydrogenase-like protein (mu-crystallin family)
VSSPPYLDAHAVESLMGPAEAADALETALRDGLDPEAAAPRTAFDTAAGELLLMPAAVAGTVGVKLATVAPGNPARGLPRIQGVYVLFDAHTLAPAALIDGIALTSARTAAVSGLAVRHLAAVSARRLLVFGSGPQAWSHVRAIRAERPIEHVDVVARDAERVAALVERCRVIGLEANAANAADVRMADVVCCCTTAREPLFDGELVGPVATVVAIGSHEPEARELDEQLFARSTIVVEARSAALREAGDVIQAIAAAACDPDSLGTLAQLARGELRVPADHPRVFKSTGMAWEDAVVAKALVERAARGS